MKRRDLPNILASGRIGGSLVFLKRLEVSVLALRARSIAGSLLLCASIFVLPWAARLALAAGYSCGSYGGFHWTQQVTATVEAQIQCQYPQRYYGWNGVDGQLTAPSTYFALPDPNQDHEIGLLGSLTSGGWFNIGWYSGTINDTDGTCLQGTCVIDRLQTYGWMVEDRNNIYGNRVMDLGLASNGSSTTDRVVYNSATGCWEAYLGYRGTLEMTDCEPNMPTSGAMIAGGEVVSHSGYFVPQPPSNFGTSDPNTNQALRLHGAAGWVPWNTTLTAQHTTSYDERSYTPTYVKSDYDAHWFFEAYSQ